MHMRRLWTVSGLLTLSPLGRRQSVYVAFGADPCSLGLKRSELSRDAERIRRRRTTRRTDVFATRMDQLGMASRGLVTVTHEDDVLQLSQPTQDENKIFAKKRKMQLDACSIKSEPCDDDVKSVCPSGELKLDCQFCGTSFESISELQTHTLRDHLPVPVPSLECQHCCAVLPSFAAFVLHMRGHLSDRDESKCPRCPLSFSDAQARLSHVISHFEVRKPLRFCMECGVSFSDSLSLGQHFMELHLKLQHLCTVCGQSCETQKEFTEHVLNHSNEATSLECGTCRVAFESRELLAMHVQLVHDREQPFDKTESAATMLRNGALLSPTIQKEIRILHCSVCDEKCYGEDALDEHRLFSHCKVPRSDACAACQAPLLTAEDFEKHTRMHTADLYMHCAVCRQSIRSETQLSLHCQFHMERRTDGEDSEQTCGICGKVLVNRYQLNVHLMEHDERRCCPHCLRPFALAQHLLTHVSEEHGEDQPLHSCEICEENFRFAVQLENHVLKHAAETKSRSNSNTPSPTELFPCQQCSMVFSSPSALLSHSRSHTESQRRCPLCGLSFNTASRFENHVRKHASTTNCVCQICGDGFASRDVLDLHMQVHKGNLELGAHNLLS
ncbi:hypothetical protein RB195_006543 [Necator americanus]|uniref:C2H2-type domain-containing protein n=1 Tax=Necator americanus TaxID=51031 RepID=A0ABR1BT44_NECAM